MDLAPLLPNERAIPIASPFDPAATTPVAFGTSTSISGEPTLDLVFTPFADGFRRYDAIKDARRAAAELVSTRERMTAVAVQVAADGAYYLGEVRTAGTLEPAFFATHDRRFQQPATGAGDVFDYAYITSYANYSS